MNSRDIFKLFDGYLLRIRYQKTQDYFKMFMKIEVIRLLLLELSLFAPWFIFQFIYGISDSLIIPCVMIMVTLFLLVMRLLEKIISVFIKQDNLTIVIIYLSLALSTLILDPNMGTLVTSNIGVVAVSETKISRLYFMFYPIYEDNKLKILLLMIALGIIISQLVKLLTWLYVKYDGSLKRCG